MPIGNRSQEDSLKEVHVLVSANWVVVMELQTPKHPNKSEWRAPAHRTSSKAAITARFVLLSSRD